MKKWAAASLMMLALATSAFAQEKEGELPKVEVFAGYAHLRSGGHGFHGWNTVVAGNVNRWFAVAADFSGLYHHQSSPAGTIRESEHTFTFGPHFALRRHPKLTPFGFALFGAARESTSVAGVATAETGFASELGGGLDWEVHPRMAIRLFEAAASVTRVGGHTHTKPKVSFGVVFLLGRK